MRGATIQWASFTVGPGRWVASLAATTEVLQSTIMAIERMKIIRVSHVMRRIGILKVERASARCDAPLAKTRRSKAALHRCLCPLGWGRPTPSHTNKASTYAWPTMRTASQAQGAWKCACWRKVEYVYRTRGEEVARCMAKKPDFDSTVSRKSSTGSVKKLTGILLCCAVSGHVGVG